MSEFKILRGPFDGGHTYTLIQIIEGKEEEVTGHFCTSDGFARSDLWRHDETREAVGDMTKEEFLQLEIAQA